MSFLAIIFGVLGERIWLCRRILILVKIGFGALLTVCDSIFGSLGSLAEMGLVFLEGNFERVLIFRFEGSGGG